MGRLTVALVRALSKPGRYGDSGTLFLRVAPGGSKGGAATHHRRQAPRSRARRLAPRDAEARIRRSRTAGTCAAAATRWPTGAAKVPTFMEASDSALEANRRRWRDAKTVDNWRATMEKYARPVFGDRPVDRVGREDVLQVLLPVWTAKPEIRVEDEGAPNTASRSPRPRRRARSGAAAARSVRSGVPVSVEARPTPE